MKKNKSKTGIICKKRIYLLTLVLFLLNSAIGTRLYYLSADQSTRADTSFSSYTLPLCNKRGTIYDRNGVALTNTKTRRLAVFTPDSLTIPHISAYLNKSQLDTLKSGKPVAVETADEFEQDGVITVDCVYGDCREAAHLIGYVDADGNGVCGIQKAYDGILNSGRLVAAVRQDAMGRALSQGVAIREDDEKSGSVKLTLDSRWQKAAWRALRESSIERGSAVVLDNKSGEILALVSAPDFDPSHPEDYLKEANAPFINRGLSAFPVGSAFKISTACAALGKGISPTHNCTGAITVDGSEFICMNFNSHGVCDMKRAISLSCNTYFIALSKLIPSAILLEQAELFGYGSEIKLAPSIAAAKGSLPSRSSLKMSGEKANFAFGQGSLTASPLQVASMIQTICNGGKRIVPTLIKSVTDKDGTNAEVTPSAPIHAVDGDIAGTIKSWLISAVKEGTGAVAGIDGLTIGGKTATAETGKISDVWFAGFCENYGVSIVVLCENGTSGSKDAAPVFKKILEYVK